MPTYEYECTACGKVFETHQSMTEPPLTDCPTEFCGKQGTVKRLISAGAGLIFKGSGFYITDYKNGGSKSASSPATSEAKSEAAPASCPCAPNGGTPPCKSDS